MKIEKTEKSIRLIAESEWEHGALLSLRQEKIEYIRFQNDWDSEGYLELKYLSHPWDSRR